MSFTIKLIIAASLIISINAYATNSFKKQEQAINVGSNIAVPTSGISKQCAKTLRSDLKDIGTITNENRTKKINETLEFVHKAHQNKTCSDEETQLFVSNFLNVFVMEIVNG